MFCWHEDFSAQKTRISRIEKFKLDFAFKEKGIDEHSVYKPVTDFVTSFLSEDLSFWMKSQ